MRGGCCSELTLNDLRSINLSGHFLKGNHLILFTLIQRKLARNKLKNIHPEIWLFMYVFEYI